jgi:MFS family permease
MNEPTGADPRRLMATGPMRWQQVLAIAVCVALNALDGFDVLDQLRLARHRGGMGHRPQGIGLCPLLRTGRHGGGLDPAGPIGRPDRAARHGAGLPVPDGGRHGLHRLRPFHRSIGRHARHHRAWHRGMLAVTNALVAEYANDRWRSAAVTIMAAGYPMGAIAGGSIASALLATGTWRDVFLLGCGMTLVLLPFVALFLPEPVSAVLLRRDEGTLQRLNASLRRLGHAPVAALPPATHRARKTTLADLFAPDLRNVTIMLTAAYFMHILTFYFILKWVPKVVADMGYTASSAGGVLVWANVGGLLGGLAFAGLSLVLPLRRLIIAFMLASLATVTWFGQPHEGLRALSWAAAIGGFCTNAGVVGIYALVASSFPTARARAARALSSAWAGAARRWARSSAVISSPPVSPCPWSPPSWPAAR